ncbi:hypothetical protein LguiA_024109 [Lonicera macranthoides]
MRSSGAENTSIALTNAKPDSSTGLNNISKSTLSTLNRNSLTTVTLAAKLIKSENPLHETLKFAFWRL